MDTQNTYVKYAVLVNNSLVYKMKKEMEIQNRSNEMQVESLQQKSPMYDRYIKEVAGDSNFAKQQSRITEKQLNSREVFVEALKTTATAAHSIYNDAEHSMPNDASNELFQKLATDHNQEMQFNLEHGELSYKNLKITASMVEGKLEANIFMRGSSSFNELIDAVKDFYQIANIQPQGAEGRYEQGGVYFPQADGKYEDFKHFYVTSDNTVVMDKHSFDIIVKAYEQANMMVPECVAQKYKYYSSANVLQNTEEQKLAFTHKQLQEINEALRKPRAEAQNSYEVDVLKQQMADIQQKHLLEVQRLQQVNEQQQTILKNVEKIFIEEFGTNGTLTEVDAILEFRERFGHEYNENDYK